MIIIKNKKKRSTKEQSFVLGKLVKFNWNKEQAIATILNKDIQLNVFYDVFEKMKMKQKGNLIKNPGAYIRKSIMNYLQTKNKLCIYNRFSNTKMHN